MSIVSASFTVTIATSAHFKYAEPICNMIVGAAKKRGTGIAKRTPAYILTKMEEGKAIIAIEEKTEKIAGFCYIEAWGGKGYVANSGINCERKF